LVDFGREFQGGVVLSATGAAAGTTLRFISGELLLPNGTYDAATESRIASSNTWGYEFSWTLREGDQTISQHNYMLFRYLAVVVTSGSVPLNFTVSAWTVQYEYVPTDSAFVSADSVLNAVHELARWTLEGGVVDTYTDSNTRERRPYECDGMIAAAGRGTSHIFTSKCQAWECERRKSGMVLGEVCGRLVSNDASLGVGVADHGIRTLHIRQVLFLSNVQRGIDFHRSV
jgi:hypothetical protein